MGLDWIIEAGNDYDGPRNYRAKGLSWVLEESGYLDSANRCYGQNDPDSQLTKLSDKDMSNILKDLQIIIKNDKFPKSILDNINKTELMGHLTDAETILDKVLNYQGKNKPCIYGDY